MDNMLNIFLVAIITALGSAIGAGLFSMFSKFSKKRDEKLLNEIALLRSEVQLLMRYNLQQSAVIETILDAMKTNHINGNIERAVDKMTNAQNELNNGLIQHATTGRK